jgi:ATP-dependent 26S proteasome regulatory subunit
MTSNTNAQANNIFSASSFFDQNLLYQSVNTLFSNGQSPSKYDLIKVLLLLGSDSYKQLVKELMDYTVKCIKEFDIKNVFECVKNLIFYTIRFPRTIYTYFVNCKKTKSESLVICDVKEEQKINKFKIDISAKAIFWKKIINNSDCSYDIIPSKIIQIDNKRINVLKQFYNIKIQKEDYTLFINKNVQCEFIVENGIETFSGIKFIDNSSLKDYFPKYEEYDVEKTYLEYVNKIGNNPYTASEFFEIIFPNKEISDFVTEIYIKITSGSMAGRMAGMTHIWLLDAPSPQNTVTGGFKTPICRTNRNHLDFLSVLVNRFSKTIKTTKTISNTKELLLYGFKYKIQSSNLNYGFTNYEAYMKVEKYKEVYDFLEKNNKDGLLDIAQEYLVKKSTVLNITFDNPKQNTENNINNDITILMESHSIPSETLQSIFIKDFMLSDEPVIEANKNNKIKINAIYIKDTKIIKKIDNPDYDEWKQKLEEVKNMIGENKDNDVLSNLIKDCPSKTIETKTNKKEIKVEEINSVYKDFSTLYLSKNDKTILYNMLDNFKNKKELLEELGIPNKLGILLYGQPGCGKTTTITAIASYLQKDIYYVNLNGVKTNEDLKMIFDHVISGDIKSGIIVMEDIDAMCKIVHKRETNNRDLSVSEVHSSEKNELTLEYFLNILQGSLTRNDTIFITTTNHIEVLDPAFVRDGRFDVKIEMLPADRYQIQNIYNVFFKRNISDEIINKISEYKYTPATLITHFVQYIMQVNVSDEIILNKFINL